MIVLYANVVRSDSRLLGSVKAGVFPLILASSLAASVRLGQRQQDDGAFPYGS